MNNYFRATVSNPFHISIGGLVFNDEGKILVHHFRNKNLGGYFFEDLYLLLRETIEPNESIEQALARGLMEEFGLKGELVKYLGSIKGRMPLKNNGEVVWAEKTTLYFLIRYLEHDESRRERGSSESESLLEWVDPKTLISYMEKQASVDSALDESSIVYNFISKVIE